MWNPWADSTAREELKARLKWFLLGRVAVLSCFFFVVAFGYLGRGEHGYLISINTLLFIVGLTYALTLISALMIDRLEELTVFSYSQLCIDLLLITGAIYLTGGIDSPFAFLFSLAIVNAAVLLFANGAMFTAVAATVCYDALLVSGAIGVIELPRTHGLDPQGLDAAFLSRVLTTNLTFVLIALLSGFLARRIFEAERLLEEKRAERDRITILKDTLAQAIGSTLVTTDPDGRILAVERSGEGIFDDHFAESLRGKDIGDVFPALKLTASARLRFLQSPGALQPIEFAHRQGEGEATDMRCSTAPLRDTFGHTIGALYVLQDVTTFREIEADPPASESVTELCDSRTLPGGSEDHKIEGLLGKSAVIANLANLIKKVAGSDATVLVTGESGTGKEVAARSIHTEGPRRDKPFVALNCGAIAENLIESELFGHVKGSFTGADANRAGAFRMADGGTIFLDEIGEIPLHLQVKLLRVLQERTFRPVGSETSVAVDVRIIAATNRDLAKEVREGNFREDLFYRLNVIEIHIAPLRDRSEDIPILVRHFLKHFSGVHDREINRFSPEAARLLVDYDYPGNVRELENIVEHAVALCDGECAEVDHLPIYLTDGVPSHAGAGAPPRPTSRPSADPGQAADTANDWDDIDLERDLAEYEKNILLRALNEAGGVKKKAAELLGINYRSLRHRLQKYGLGDIGPGSSTVQ